MTNIYEIRVYPLDVVEVKKLSDIIIDMFGKEYLHIFKGNIDLEGIIDE